MDACVCICLCVSVCVHAGDRGSFVILRSFCFVRHKIVSNGFDRNQTDSVESNFLKLRVWIHEAKKGGII